MSAGSSQGSKTISLEEIGWRTGLTGIVDGGCFVLPERCAAGVCNECYDNIGGCRAAVSRKRPHIRTLAPNEWPQLTKLPTRTMPSSRGLCDACYAKYNTVCVRCNENIPDDELLIGSVWVVVLVNCSPRSQACHADVAKHDRMQTSVGSSAPVFSSNSQS